VASRVRGQPATRLDGWNSVRLCGNRVFGRARAEISRECLVYQSGSHCEDDDDDGEGGV
jgi:hypothetical protein